MSYRLPEVTIEQNNILTARWSQFHIEKVDLDRFDWYKKVLKKQEIDFFVTPFQVYFFDGTKEYIDPRFNLGTVKFTVSKSSLYLMQLHFMCGEKGLKIGVSYDPKKRSKDILSGWKSYNHDGYYLMQVEVLVALRSKSEGDVLSYERECKKIIREYGDPIAGTHESILLPSPVALDWDKYLVHLIKHGDLF